MADHYQQKPVAGDPEPRGAFDRDEFYDNVEEKTGWRPTRKWVAAFVTGAVVFGLSLLDITDLDPQIEQVINVLAMLIAGYAVPNDPTSGGVPDA